MLFCCAQAGMAFDVCAIVRDDYPRLAALFDQRHWFARHPLSRDRRIGSRRQALSSRVIDDVQGEEQRAAGELVV